MSANLPVRISIRSGGAVRQRCNCTGLNIWLNACKSNEAGISDTIAAAPAERRAVFRSTIALPVKV